MTGRFWLTDWAHPLDALRPFVGRRAHVCAHRARVQGLGRRPLEDSLHVGRLSVSVQPARPTLARLGLRASDVVSLRLDDVDWPDGSFSVSGKTSREVRLPLPQEVGDALLSYLPRRPDVNADVVFVRHKAPLGPLTTTSVSFIAADAMGRVGVKTKSGESPMKG